MRELASSFSSFSLLVIAMMKEEKKKELNEQEKKEADERYVTALLASEDHSGE